MTIGPLELFGTLEPSPARTRLTAGKLSAVLEEGNLRDIRFGGVEVVRAINYLARDESWGTFKPAISGLHIEQRADGFSVDYDGLCGEPGRGFAYRMRIRGEASGRLKMEAEGVALADFLTNRTGFVILHAAEVAGGRMSLLHGDGGREEAVFPLAVSADQPALDVAAITHEPAPGLSCTIAMEGEVFEMEDQRNWADASFKTYVRPLAKPRPYVIAKDARDVQRIVVTVEGGESEGRPPLRLASQATSPPIDGGEEERRQAWLPSSTPRSGGEVARPQGETEWGPSLRESIGASVGRMPEIALFVDGAGLGALRAEDAPQRLVVRLDAEDAGASGALEAAAGFARAAAAEIAVEVVFSTRDADREAAEALRLLEASGLQPSALLVSPRREFRTRASFMLPEGEVAIDALVDALRRAGFSGRIGAGTPSYFTEFNRNPPGRQGDFVFFSVAAIVHAADDISVAETLSVYPTVVASARALCPGKPVWLGPCTIGVRHNPYGTATQPNPENGRVPSATLDPRHAALFGAAYATAAAAQAATAGVEAVTLAAPAGPFGMMDIDGRQRPMARIVEELAAAAGAPCRAIESGHAHVYGVTWDCGWGFRGLVANLGERPVDGELPAGFSAASLLLPDASWSEPAQGRLDLPPYRTALLTA